MCQPHSNFSKSNLSRQCKYYLVNANMQILLSRKQIFYSLISKYYLNANIISSMQMLICYYQVNKFTIPVKTVANPGFIIFQLTPLFPELGYLFSKLSFFAGLKNLIQYASTITHRHFAGAKQLIKFQMSFLKNTDINFTKFLTRSHYTNQGT